MWARIASLEPIVQAVAPAFTPASFVTHGQFFLAWILCLGRHRLGRVADNTQPQQLRDHSQRHGLDTYYHFFERSAWNPATLAYHVAVLILTRLKFTGPITLLVDDTLTHKRGKSVWGLGWFRSAPPPFPLPRPASALQVPRLSNALCEDLDSVRLASVAALARHGHW